MSDHDLLSSWVRRFLLEHLLAERNYSANTQKSYRDTLRMLLPYVAKKTGKAIDRLAVFDISNEHVRTFLAEIESARKCGPATRNQRLAAIRSMAHFISQNSPEHIEWYGSLKNIPMKKSARPLIPYLEKDEMDALLAAPDLTTYQGRRDHAVLLFMYNTGARADEVAHVQLEDLTMNKSQHHDRAFVLIHGKGNKQRLCPLWRRTSCALNELVTDKDLKDFLFINRRGDSLTRFGIHALVERHAAAAAKEVPSISKKRVSPHTIRHTTATHLLRAGVDINTIRAWLGHVSLATTNIYAEVDLEMKAQALALCEIKGEKRSIKWRDDNDLMTFLQAL